MRPDFFASLLLGHLVGDYLLQNKWMAMNKSASTWKALVHCTIYSEAIMIFTYTFFNRHLIWGLLVFLSHFPIDRWGLADKWLDLINGRSLRDYIYNGRKNIPVSPDLGDNYHALRGGFTALVYAVADNTMHMVIMYYGALFLFARGA